VRTELVDLEKRHTTEYGSAASRTPSPSPRPEFSDNVRRMSGRCKHMCSVTVRLQCQQGAAPPTFAHTDPPGNACDSSDAGRIVEL
jgi:hypothetical protein